MDAYKKSMSKGVKGCGKPFCKYCGYYTKKDKRMLRRLARRRLKNIKEA